MSEWQFRPIAIPRAVTLLVREPRTFYRRAHRLLRPMRKDYRERLSMSLREWIPFHQTNIHFQKSHWMGIRALKNPLDAWIYQEIIYEVKPDIVIEIGSMEGGSTLYLAHLLELLGKGQVVSIDIDRTVYKAKHPRIVELTGSSSSSEILCKMSTLCEGKTVLIIHDAAHDRTSVLRDLRNYSPLVSVNSYFIVEDGVIDIYSPRDAIGGFEEGPLAAIEEFLTENRNFIIDHDRERYIITYNPCGFLRRIR